VPKLWTETIDAHRRTVREAILETTAGLAAEHGVRSVTMSQIAEDAGIGRATLYRYFNDVESILHAWHDEQVESHLAQVADALDPADGARQQLESMLSAYALIVYETRGHGGSELAALLHAGGHAAHAQHRVLHLFESAIKAGVDAGEIRRDIPASELAAYCLHAAGGAAGLSSKSAVGRLVTMVLAGVRDVM